MNFGDGLYGVDVYGFGPTVSIDPGAPLVALPEMTAGSTVAERTAAGLTVDAAWTASIFEAATSTA